MKTVTITKIIILGLLLQCIIISNTSAQSYPTSWTAKGPGGGGAIVAASISPFNSNEFFITCDMSNLFHTTDFGQSYSMIPYTELQVQLKSEVQFTSNSSKLFVLNKTGGYVPSKSYNSGINWTNAANPCSGSAYQLFASLHDTDQVVISDTNKIYFSNTANTISSYSTLFNYTGAYGVHIAGVYFQNIDTVYICSHDSLIYTFNGGTSWLSALAGTNGIPSNEHIVSFKGAKEGNKWVFYCVTIQANSLPNIYNSSGRDCPQYKGLYKLSQGQTQWNSKGGNLPNPTLDKGYLLGLADNDTSTVYVGGNSTYLGVILGAIFKSTNGGSSFINTFLTSGMFLSNANITTGWAGTHLLSSAKFKWNGLNYILALAVDPNNSSKIICGDAMWAHSSVDNGSNWQQIYTDFNYDNAPSTLINQANEYKTTGLETTASYWLNWTSSTSIFASYNDIVARRSVDGGQKWSFDIYGLDSNKINDINMTVFNPANGLMYAAAGEQPGSNGDYTDARITQFRGRISVSPDSGKTWNTLNNFSTRAVSSIAIDPTSTTNGMYATVIDVLGGIGDVYHCTDVVNNSNTWNKLSSPPRTEGRPLQIIVLNTDTLIAVYGARDSTNSGPAKNKFTASSGVFYSTDNGSTWIDRSHSKMTVETVNVEVDPNDPTRNTWLAFVGSKKIPPAFSAPGVYRSINRGITWTNVYNQSSLSGTFHPTLPNELYICTVTQGLQYATNTNNFSFATNHVASYPFRNPQKVFFNPYDANEVWVASFGNGFREGKTLVTGNPLPIELISFSGKAIADKNILYWTTANEFQNDYFTILKSTNGNNFNSMATVNGAGNSTHTLNYSIEDEHPLGKINYYILQQTDYNGNNTFSKAIAINSSSDRINLIIISPNPATDFIQISFLQKENNYEIEITNTLGELIIKKQNEDRVDVSSLPNGIYFIKVTENHDSNSQKFIKL
ncbi:MAG: T9SS type A sorting domain-containing protein [Bacteroidia bacterium]